MVQDQSPPFVDLTSRQDDGSVLTLDILCGQAAAADKFVQLLGCQSGGSCADGKSCFEMLKWCASKHLTIRFLLCSVLFHFLRYAFADIPLVQKLRNTVEEARDIFAAALSAGVGRESSDAVHARSNATNSEAHDRSILTITLLNYVEDIVAQTVGFDHVGSFLQQCILAQPSVVLEQLMVANIY